MTLSPILLPLVVCLPLERWGCYITTLPSPLLPLPLARKKKRRKRRQRKERGGGEVVPDLRAVKKQKLPGESGT